MIRFALLLAASLARGATPSAVPDEPALFGAVIADVDANGDGKLSRSEYTRLDAMTNFDGMDVNHDGFATVAELGTWVKVTQPRPRERLRPDTLGFGPPARASAAGAPPSPSASTPSLAVAGPLALLLAGLVAAGVFVKRRGRRAR